MIHVKLYRLEQSVRHGTFGVLLIDGKSFCVTLEPPDQDNQSNISSIPAGEYNCVRYDSPKYGDTFQILYVPNRDFILFHSGNVVEHTKGCVLLGQYFDKLSGERAVLNSGKTFRRFMRLLEGFSEFQLTLVNLY